MVTCSSVPLSKEAFKAAIVGKSTVTAKIGTDLQGRKGQLEIICQRSFRLHSLPSYLVFCWPLLRAKADSLTSRRGFAATPPFHLALWEHKCMCPPTLIKLMQLILFVAASLWFNSKRPTDAEALPQSSMWVSYGHMRKRWGSRDTKDSTQTTCLQGHAGSSLLFLPYFCLCKGYTSHLIWNTGDGPLFSSKVHATLFPSPFVDPWALKYV